MTESLPRKQFYFKEQLAYNADHKVVKSLFITYECSSPELEPKQLRGYFAQFGPILQLHVFQSATEQRSGNVVFADPMDAAKALKQSNHCVGNRTICVQPTESGQQQDEEIVYHNHQDNTGIMHLNDHCLEHIFCQLSLADRLHFAATCNRFHNIYVDLSRRLDKSVKLDSFEALPLLDVRRFFELSGCNVRHLEGIIPKRYLTDLCELIGLYCINLQSISIKDTYLNEKLMDLIFWRIKSLVSVELRDCNLIDHCLHTFTHMEKLKKLDLSNNQSLFGAFSLPAALESLILNRCTSLEPKLLPEMLKRVKQFKELNVLNIFSNSPPHLFSDKAFAALEVLAIRCDCLGSSAYNHIAKLPCLRKLILHLHHNYQSLSSMLISLEEHKSEQLEHLEVYQDVRFGSEILLKIGKLSALRTLALPVNDSINDATLVSLYTLQNLEELDIKFNSVVTDNGVLRMILACPKLKLLHLDDCEMLTDKLLHDIMLKLQRNPTRRPLPIKLHMTGTVLTQGILRRADVAAKTIVDVVCDFSDDEDEDNSSLDSELNVNNPSDYEEIW